MQPYDICMILVLLGATAFGAWKGLMWQLASMAAIVVSYIVAVRFRQPVAAAINVEQPWNLFIAMLLLYLGTSLVIWIGFRFISDFIDRIRLKEFDRQVGALFGLAKGVVLCVLITLFAVALSSDHRRRQIIDSKSGYYIAVLLDRSHAVMPAEMHDVIGPYVDSLDERLEGEESSGKGPLENLQDDVGRLLNLRGRDGESTSR